MYSLIVTAELNDIDLQAWLAGVEEDLIEEIASMAMEPEDGRISIIDSNNDDAPSATAFTRDGIDYLKETINDPSSCYYRPSPRF